MESSAGAASANCCRPVFCRVRPRLRSPQRQRPTWRQRGLGCCEPREPRHLHGLGPERERIGALDIAAEPLEGGHRLEVDRSLLGIPGRLSAMYDFDVQAGQASGGPGSIDHRLLSEVLWVGQRSSPHQGDIAKVMRPVSSNDVATSTIPVKSSQSDAVIPDPTTQAFPSCWVSL
jgi:hypothetical protein